MAKTRGTRTKALTRAAVIAIQDQITRMVKEESVSRVKYYIGRTTEEAVRNEVSFAVMFEFRVYSVRAGERFKLIPARLKRLWSNMKFNLRTYITASVRTNMLASYAKGGTLRDDVMHPGRRWANWKPSYVRWRKYQAPAVFGKKMVLSGELLSALQGSFDELVKVRFTGDTEKFIFPQLVIDFGSSKNALKLAVFHGGSKRKKTRVRKSGGGYETQWEAVKGVGSQDPRPFTFIVARNFFRIEEEIRKATKGFRDLFHTAVLGMRAGELPAIERGRQAAFQEMRLISMSKLGEGM